ncbi:hypothetical protein C8R45DRAFT_1108803 [Mycena sanguinolenta]|nr:hypothetical protein C8R45DRAFT_1108803 [Mycena sanguinolenta]
MTPSLPVSMDHFVPGNTLGALEIGILLSFMLYGVSLTQTYIYYNPFPDDPPKLKALRTIYGYLNPSPPAFVRAHTRYASGMDYTPTRYSTMDVEPERLAYALPKSILVGGFLSAVISAIVQGFFTFRTHVFTKSLCTCFIISGMMFLRFLATSAVFSLAFGMTLLVPFATQWGWLLIVASIGSAVTDLTIAVILTVSLRNQSRGVHKRTMALVDKIIAWTIG